MENNNKTNDMFLAVVRNPTANTYDFLDNGINPINTQLKDRDYYKDKEVITSQFMDEEGKFNEESFNKAYQLALYNYNQLSNEEALKNLEEVKYNPFDTTRPMGTKKWDVEINYSTDYNPYRSLYSRDHLNSITDSKLSLREIAQKGGVHDLKTNTWEKSVNTWNIFKKAFGDTLVYAQWDEDGIHTDVETGQLVKHKKGDWKVNDNGSLYLEKLGDREIYGKQVVSVTDILTADESFWNKLDPFDSDGREKSASKIAAKTIIQIAPLLIPGVQTYYAGVRASIGLISVLPTFYKGLESLLLGDNKSFITDPASRFEGWMAKHNAKSSSDKGSESMWNFEQMGQMVTDIFAQIYEQRAMASLSKHLVKTEQLMDKRMMELQGQVIGKASRAAQKYGIDANKAIDRAVQNLPELQKAIEKQSYLSKAFSLGYMALTSTGDVYGEAIESGYDRRTAGFAALLIASGQYGIMMNNRMGDWFLDKSTGYSMETNRALMKRSIKPYIKEIDKIITDSGLSKEAQKAKLASLTTSFKKTLNRTFKDYTIVGEGMWKNAVIEGVEEVTEQVVEDLSKGLIDLFGYFGWTKGKGSFDTVGRYTSAEAYNEYLANFVGGVLGGGLFELERSVIAPALNPKLRAQSALSADLNQSIYEMVAAGHKDLLVDMIKKESKLLADNNLSYLQEDGEFLPSETISQSDLVAQKAIEIVNQLESVFLSEGLLMTDEEIVNKAIRDQVMITEFEKNQEEGNLLGLEALILKDFKETALQVANVKNTILELEKEQNRGNDVEAQIKNEKEKLKELTTKTNGILKGEYGMHYFNQLSFALVDAISSKYGSFDRDTYLQTVYGKSYEDFPEKGILTKQMVNKEWEDFLDSSDLKKKLEVATGAFLHYEALINPIMAQYVKSGYSEERAKTYELLIDLKRTTELFKLEDNPENKNKLITNFINIMNSLESQGIVKFGTWDVYKTNVFEKFMENNMFKKVNYDTDENGNTVKTYEDITEDFLNAKNSDGITNRDQMENFVNTIAAHFPAQAFDTKEMIKSFNEASQNRGSEIFNTYTTLKNKENKTQEDLDALTLMENDLFSIELLTLNDLPAIKELNTKAGEEMIVIAEKYFPEIFGENLEQYEKVQKVAMEKKRHKMFMDNKARYSKTFEDIAKEVLGDNYKENFDDYTDDEIIVITNKFNELGLTYEAALKLDNVDEIAAMHEEIKTNDNVINAEQKEVFRTLFEAINDVISEANQIINNEDFQKYNDEIKLIENQLKSDIEKVTPEIMKLQDMAYDIVLKTLESGVIDKEIYETGKEMMFNLINSEIAKSFKNPDNVTLDKVIEFYKNQELISKIHSLINRQSLGIMFDDIDYETGDLIYSYLPGFESFSKLWSPSQFSSLMDALNYQNFDMLPEELKDYMNDESFKTMSDKFKNLVTSEEWNLYKSFILSYADLDLSYGDFNAKSALEELNKKKTFANIQEIQNKFNSVTSDEGKYISNPFYDWLRKHFITLDSGEKALTVLDILQREQTAYNASTGASNYISEGVRPQDILQAKKLLELIKVNVMAASETDLFGHSLGFVKMRQDFAKRNEIQDDVLNLEIIASENGYTLTKDIERLITKLDFLLGLSTFNSKRQATEQKEIGLKVQQILIDSWDSIINNDIGNKFIPREEIIEILNSNEENSQKLLEIEDAVYSKNKSNKNEALRSLLGHFENVQFAHRSKYSKDMTAADMTELDIVNYLATVLSVKSSEYLKYKYNNLKTDNKAPFYMQEMVAKQIYAHTSNPLLFEEIFKAKIDNVHSDASYVTVVLGAAGSGKTTAIMGPVLDIIRQSNKESDIWLSAPNKSQVNKLEAVIKSSVGEEGIKFNNLDKKELFFKFGEKVSEFYEEMQDELRQGNFPHIDDDSIPESAILYFNKRGHLKANIPQELTDSIDFNTLPNLLVIDEITHFSAAEIQLLSMISEASLKTNSGNFMSVVGLGDQNQLGFSANYMDKLINFNVESIKAVFTPMLQSSIRSSNDQQRVNYDILLNLVSNAVARSAGITDDSEMNLKVQTYLQDVNTETGLKYYLTNEDFKGIYIDDSNILEPLKAIAHTKKTKPETKVGILTENNEIPESIKKYLDLVGLSEEDLEIFTPLNVQGSEVDYFIFGTLDIFKWGKYRDNLKALYTYASRSTEGSVILDYDGKLKNLLNISNADASNTYQPYDPLNKSVIDELIQERIEEIEKLLENSFELKEDTFKWIRNIDGKTSNSPDLAFGVIPNSNLFIEKTENGSELTEDQKKTLQKANVKIEDFKIMLHSFYNSPGAELRKDSSGKVIEIVINPENPNIDLNGWGNPLINIDKVIDQWIDLKYQLLFKKGKFDTLEYKDYLSHIFNDNFDNAISSSNIEVEYLMTAQRYKSELHDPYAKHEGDEEKQLKSSDIFINLTAKLTINGRNHFITLATFPKLDTILNQGLKYVKGSEEEINRLSDQITDFYDKVDIIPLDSKQLYNLGKIDLDNYRFITGTRMVSVDPEKKPKHYLTNLKRDFPGLHYSEMRLFPGNFTDFKNLLNKYEFGEKRGEKKTEDLFKMMKNKPYIVVSFESKQSLEGSATGDSQAKLIPIGSSYRNMDVLITEILDLKDEVNTAIAEHYEGSDDNYIPSPVINAKFETLLNATQILDILIKWGKTTTELIKDGDDNNLTLLDLLIQSLDIQNPTSLFKNDTKILDVLSNFKGSESKTNNRLEYVINVVKSELQNENNTDDSTLKKAIIGKIRKMTGWNWNFYNLFNYSNIIDSKFNKQTIELFKKGFYEEGLNIDSLNDEDANKLKLWISTLLNTIKDEKFYYSVPLSLTDKSEIRVNSYVGGDTGFKKEFFGDKFYILGSPEGPRMLLDFNKIIDPEIHDIHQSTDNSISEPQTKEVVEEVVKEVVEEVEEITSEPEIVTDLAKVKIKSSRNSILTPFVDNNKTSIEEILNNFIRKSSEEYITTEQKAQYLNMEGQSEEDINREYAEYMEEEVNNILNDLKISLSYAKDRENSMPFTEGIERKTTKQIMKDLFSDLFSISPNALDSFQIEGIDTITNIIHAYTINDISKFMDEALKNKIKEDFKEMSNYLTKLMSDLQQCN